jgi:TonB-dependent receptor
MRKIIFVLNAVMLVFSICCTNIFAASTASIEGFVKDAETGAVLPGANVILVGTSMGGATDINGKYEIQNVPPGSYVLRASYIGYQNEEFNVTIKEGLSLRQDFDLHAVGVQGKTVVVTAQASGQNAAINQQLSSQQIVSVVSAAKIQELPDANAAESLGRLPGISVLRSGGEADEVVIRGLAPKFNRVMINGVELTSSNPNDESIDLSMISSNMLAGMEVAKTVTPDMDADVVGGTINLELREAQVKEPGVPQFGLVLQGGYNGLADIYNKYNNYKYVGSAEDRFFNNNFGVFVQADVERKNLTSNQLGASYTHNGNSTSQYLTGSLNLDNIPRDRVRYDGTITLDYKMPDGTLKFSNFFSTGTTNILDRGESYDIADNLHDYSLGSTNSTLSVITNSLKFQYQLPIFHVDAQVSHAYTETKDPHDWTTTFQQGSVGLNTLFGVANLNPQQIPSYSNNDQNATIFNSVQSFSSFSGARALTGSLDLQTNLNFSDLISAAIKFGGMYRYEYRNYVYGQTRSDGLGLESADFVDSLIAAQFPSTRQYVHSTKIPLTPYIDPSYNYGKFLGGSYVMGYPLNFAMLNQIVNFLDNNIGLIAKNSDAITYSNDSWGSQTYNYNGHENQSAAYIMGTFNIGSDITIIPGVRYQNLQTTYTGTQGQQTSASAQGGPYTHYDSTITVNHGYWLPDVALRYKPESWFDIRLSYTHTLAYPDFEAIIPRIDIPASTGGTISWNNAYLSPSRSTNYDVYFSFYNNAIGLFTIGGFLKQIHDLIYPWTFYVSGAQALPYYPAELKPNSTPGSYSVATYINDPNEATDYGLELDWQTHFWYLPHPLDGLVLSLNYTHVYSKETYPFVNIEKVGRSILYVDTSFTDRLLYQPDNIANLSVGYDYEGFSVRVSMIYQDNIFSGPNFWPQLRTTTTAYTRWDISAKQDLPWYGLQIYGDLSNVNGESDIDVIQASTGVPQAEQDYGMTADLGLRLKL